MPHNNDVSSTGFSFSSVVLPVRETSAENAAERRRHGSVRSRSVVVFLSRLHSGTTFSEIRAQATCLRSFLIEANVARRIVGGRFRFDDQVCSETCKRKRSVANPRCYTSKSNHGNAETRN